MLEVNDIAHLIALILDRGQDDSWHCNSSSSSHGSRCLLLREVWKSVYILLPLMLKIEKLP